MKTQKGKAAGRNQFRPGELDFYGGTASCALSDKRHKAWDFCATLRKTSERDLIKFPCIQDACAFKRHTLQPPSNINRENP